MLPVSLLLYVLSTNEWMNGRIRLSYSSCASCVQVFVNDRSWLMQKLHVLFERKAAQDKYKINTFKRWNRSLSLIKDVFLYICLRIESLARWIFTLSGACRCADCPVRRSLHVPRCQRSINDKLNFISSIGIMGRLVTCVSRATIFYLVSCHASRCILLVSLHSTRPMCLWVAPNQMQP